MKLTVKIFPVLLNVMFIVSLFSFQSCEEVIDIDVENPEQKIVIDAAFTDTPNESRVLLSKTENVFISGSNTKVLRAEVYLSDDTGNTEQLVESQQGRFVSSSIEKIWGRTYTLKVRYDGLEYSGTSKLNEPMKIDTVKFEKTTSNSIWGILYGSYKMKIYITNKLGVNEYCIIKIKDSQGKKVKSTILYQDKYADGKQTIIENNNTKFQIGETVIVEILTVDKAAYEYFYQLNELSDEAGLDLPEIINSKTYNPKSNLSNGALGCFYAYSSKKYSVTVK
jgi:hypothetical protein